MIPALILPLATASIPILSEIAVKYLKRWAEKLGNDEPELVKEIHATMASHDGERLSQLLHRLRERKKRGPAS